MSRTKKSRKQGSAPTAKPKLSQQELASVEKRVRKKKGNKAGNRQQEGVAVSKSSSGQQHKKDARIGSKTPIPLGKATEKSVKHPPKSSPIKLAPIARVSPISIEEKECTAQQELAAIEQNEALKNILTKQDEGADLTEQEVDFFNEKMERYQELSELLGLSETTQNNPVSQVADDEDLWNKLDGQDFSDFNED